MIYMYTGTPGSGKSYHAVLLIKNCLKLGKPVLSNFIVNLDLIKRRKGEFTYIDTLGNNFNPSYLKEYSRAYFGNKRVKEDEITLVIDEAQIYFNSRVWNGLSRMEWVIFLSQHRHFGYRIIFLTQWDRMLDRQIRALVEYETVHRKLKNSGFIGSLINLLLGGNMFVSVTKWYPLNEKISSDFFKGRKKHYNLYNSYNLIE